MAVSIPHHGRPLATGCLLIGLRPWLHRHAWYRSLISLPAVALWAVLALLIQLSPSITVIATQPTASSLQLRTNMLVPWGTVGFSLMNILLALCMDGLITHHRALAGRVLNSGLFVAVGVLSYSLYLWQEPFVNIHDIAFRDEPLLAVVATCFAALISYSLIERPFLALRAAAEPRIFPRSRSEEPETEIATELAEEREATTARTLSGRGDSEMDCPRCSEPDMERVPLPGWLRPFRFIPGLWPTAYRCGRCEKRVTTWS